MSMPGFPSIPSIKDQSVTVDVRTDGPRGLSVAFRGTLTPRDPGPILGPFFDKLHRAAAEQGCKRVQVDLSQLKFMNSACFKHFVAWVKQNGAQPEDRRYKIHFLVSPVHHWQAVSMSALRCFSVDEITAEEVGARQGRPEGAP